MRARIVLSLAVTSLVAFLSMPEKWKEFIEGPLNMTGRLTAALGEGGYNLLAVAAFAVMAIVLYRIARKPQAIAE